MQTEQKLRRLSSRPADKVKGGEMPVKNQTDPRPDKDPLNANLQHF